MAEARDEQVMDHTRHRDFKNMRGYVRQLVRESREDPVIEGEPTFRRACIEEVFKRIDPGSGHVRVG